jgi:hypothetical protein
MSNLIRPFFAFLLLLTSIWRVRLSVSLSVSASSHFLAAKNASQNCIAKKNKNKKKASSPI